jgi:heme/copper-type cytochrome/quinol oxidase subunit 2
MNKIKQFLIALSLIANLGLVFAPALASAQIHELRCGANSAATGDNCTPPPNTPSLNQTIENIVNVITSLVGVAAVIMILIAGFRYVASGGKDDTVKSAKNTITYAVIGLVIVGFAQIIVHFVINKISQAT